MDTEGKSIDKWSNYNIYYNSHSNRYQLPRPVESCNMTLRLKSVGLGFSAIPERIVETDTSRNINIKTTATYLEPNYISVHAYNCKNILARRRTGGDSSVPSGNVRVYRERTDDSSTRRNSNYRDHRDGEEDEDLESEMEQVFIKGSRTLLTNYMEKQFKTVLRDSLMTNLGYTVSYGRK